MVKKLWDRVRCCLTWLVLGLLGIMSASGASAATDRYARVCVSNVDADSKESPLTQDPSPAPGNKLVIHLDANTECAALIVPLAQNGSRLANGWKPQMVMLPPWDERTLPNSRTAWEWNKDSQPFELWVFFFRRDANSLPEIQKMVAAMQTPELDEKILTQQTRKLCEILSPRMTGKQPLIQEHKATVALVGGTVRGTEFPWRDYAEKVPLNDALEGTLVVRHGR